MSGFLVLLPRNSFSSNSLSFLYPHSSFPPSSLHTFSFKCLWRASRREALQRTPVKLISDGITGGTASWHSPRRRFVRGSPSFSGDVTIRPPYRGTAAWHCRTSSVPPPPSPSYSPPSYLSSYRPIFFLTVFSFRLDRGAPDVRVYSCVFIFSTVHIPSISLLLLLLSSLGWVYHEDSEKKEKRYRYSSAFESYCIYYLLKSQ